MSFVEVTKVQQLDSHNYEASFHPDWVIGSVPHGGIVTSTFLSVARAHFSTTLRSQNQPHTLALHLDFLRRTQTGPANFTVKDVKLGRQTSVVHVTLHQEGREEVVGYITQSNLAREKGESFATAWELQPPVPASRAPDFGRLVAEGEDEGWVEKREWPHAAFRKASGQIRAWFPRGGQVRNGIYDQWMCLRDEKGRWTDVGLGYAVDVFPQILEAFLLDGTDPYHPDADAHAEELDRKIKAKAAFWYPTLLLNLEVKKALPEEGVKFLFSRVRAKTIKNGRYDLEVVIMDEGGEVVALSHHVCFAVSAARNLAARRKDGEEKTKL